MSPVGRCVPYSCVADMPGTRSSSFRSVASLLKAETADDLLLMTSYKSAALRHARPNSLLAMPFLQVQQPDNFLATMYSGKYSLADFPSHQKLAFYKKLEKVAAELAVTEANFSSGSDFKSVACMLLAKLSNSDWTPLDRCVLCNTLINGICSLPL